MKLLAIEPTPNPNSMKLTLSEKLPEGLTRSYVKERRENAPELLRKILEIDGVKSIFQVSDFIAVERNPKFDWSSLLKQIEDLFGSENRFDSMQMESSDTSEVRVFVQRYKGIPMQIKLLTGTQDIRVALPERFGLAARKATQASNQFLQERKWVAEGVQTGDPKTIGDEWLHFLDRSYDENRLEELVQQAWTEEQADWQKRLSELEQLHPTQEDLGKLAAVIQDENASVRRLAAVYLGMVGGSDAVRLLIGALKDTSVAVRRAAGDSLSDLADPSAIPAMVDALKDQSKLVRWRAAKYLHEVGDKRALPALEEAMNDPEYEVALQAKLAVEQIRKEA